MSGDNEDPKDKYPPVRTTSEARRLRAQHDLCTAAVGGLILAPVDLTRPNLRVLDSGTADGYFLVDLYSKLPASTRKSAELLGTDIASYPPPVDFELPASVKLSKQDMLESWPESWKRSFDLVCQRAAIPNAGNYETAVDVVRKLAELVKPGGYLQLVDGLMPTGEIKDGDPPSQQVFKIVGNALQSRGLHTNMGWRIGDMLEEAGVVEVQRVQGPSRLGRGVDEALQEASDVWFSGFESTFTLGLEKSPTPPISVAQWKKLSAEMRAEAEERGVDLTWYGAWGKVL